jgi:hypothetical protein
VNFVTGLLGNCAWFKYLSYFLFVHSKWQWTDADGRLDGGRWLSVKSADGFTGIVELGYPAIFLIR